MDPVGGGALPSSTLRRRSCSILEARTVLCQSASVRLVRNSERFAKLRVTVRFVCSASTKVCVAGSRTSFCLMKMKRSAPLRRAASYSARVTRGQLCPQ